MVKIKEGFKGERFVFLPEQLLEEYAQDPLIGQSLYPENRLFPTGEIPLYPERKRL